MQTRNNVKQQQHSDKHHTVILMYKKVFDILNTVHSEQERFFCCSPFKERENAQRLLKTRGKPLVDGCSWRWCRLRKKKKKKHTGTRWFPYLWVVYRRNQIKAWDKMTSVTTLTHISFCYMEKRQQKTWKSDWLSLFLTLCSSTPQLLWDVDKCSASLPKGNW